MFERIGLILHKVSGSALLELSYDTLRTEHLARDPGPRLSDGGSGEESADTRDIGGGTFCCRATVGSTRINSDLLVMSREYERGESVDSARSCETGAMLL